MELLILGLVIWVVVHLFPMTFQARRQIVLSKMGEGPYKGLFALLIIASIVFMVQGWKATIPTEIYTTTATLRHLAITLVVISYILFVAANVKFSRIKQIIRHPQLTGMAIWSFAHLLANGDSRSVILFTTLGLWAIISIVLINRRDGEWRKSDSVISWPKELLILLGGVVMTGLFAWLHVYFSGVAII